MFILRIGYISLAKYLHSTSLQEKGVELYQPLSKLDSFLWTVFYFKRLLAV